MEQKASVRFTHDYVDAKGRPLRQPATSLVIEGELLPDSPMVHHLLDALLDKKNPPKVVVKFANAGNRITYSVNFSHSKNVVAHARNAAAAQE